MDAGRHAGGLVVGTTRPDGSGRSLPPTAAIAGLAGGADTGLLAHVLAWAVASGREADTMGWLYGGIVVVVLALLLVGLLVDRHGRQQGHPVGMSRARLRSLRYRHARGDLGMEDNPSGARTKPAGIVDVGVEAARRSPRVPPVP